MGYKKITTDPVPLPSHEDINTLRQLAELNKLTIKQKNALKKLIDWFDMNWYRTP